MKSLMLSCEGRGKEIYEMLRKEFQLPPNVKRFQVSFEVDEPVKILCAWYVEEPDGEDDGNP